ncbi:MAG: hypothetical protein Q7R57_07050 [Dehalococcoidales bacterium]|nr:hypothetical protein [Dehalococcoidales bacterium]
MSLLSMFKSFFAESKTAVEPGKPPQPGNEPGYAGPLDIDDPQYAAKVLDFDKPALDFGTADDGSLKKVKDILTRDVSFCRKMITAWSGSGDVIKDCEKRLKSAQDEIAKGRMDTLSVANDELLRLRQRLVQAWYSKHSRPVVAFFFSYHLVLLGIVAFLLVYFRLLPGETPRLASTNINVAVLFSSALFGAAGGLCDGLFALETHYGRREFDESNSLWYLANWILGGLLGVVIFIAILAGLITTTGGGIPATTANVTQAVTANVTQVATANLTQNAAPGATPVSAGEAFIVLVAFLAGLKQMRVLGFLNRIAGSVFG